MTDRKTMQQTIDEWEQQTTHSEYCWRWHHECALKKFFNLSTQPSAKKQEKAND